MTTQRAVEAFTADCGHEVKANYDYIAVSDAMLITTARYCSPDCREAHRCRWKHDGPCDRPGTPRSIRVEREGPGAIVLATFNQPPVLCDEHAARLEEETRRILGAAIKEEST